MDEQLMAAWGRTPMFGAMPEPAMTLDFNAGMFGNNPAVAMLGNMLSSSAFKSAGLMPGKFFPIQGFYDDYYAKQYYSGQMEAMTAGAAVDRETQIATLRGIASMTGRPLTLEQERAARSLATGISTLSPTLARMMPEMFDSLHGTRGSATVAAQFIHRGGRFAQDAVTGETGMSGATSGAITRELQSRFFGPGADISSFRGLSMGRLGMLYDEAQMRGIAGPSIAAMTSQAQLAAMASDPDFIAGRLNDLGTRNEGLRQQLVSDADARMPGAAAASAARDAARRVAEDFRAVDPNRFAAMSAGATTQRRPLAYLPVDRQIDELARAGLSPVSSLSDASRDSLAKSLTGRQLADLAQSVDPNNAALAATAPDRRDAAMAALGQAERNRLVSAMNPAQQRAFLDQLPDLQRQTLGIDLQGAPAEAAFTQLGDDALKAAVTRYEQRTGRSLTGQTVASQRAALAADPASAREALQGLSAANPAALRALAAGRVASTQAVSGVGDAAAQAEELSRSPAFVQQALAAVQAARPDLYARYQQEGVIGAAQGTSAENGLAGKSIAEQNQAVAKSVTDAKATIERIKADMPEAFQSALRDFDAKKITDRLKSLSGVTSAMRDIFGDMGRPNAPMRELMEGLNQLTQGGLATQDLGSLERSVRLTQSLARSTGLGMEGMASLMARGAGMADQMGMERVFAVQGAQGAASYGQAFGQVGRGDIPHFQALDREQMTLLDQRLRMQAAKSGLANQLATATRMVDTLEAQGLTAGEGAKNLVEALKAGKTMFRDPTTGQDVSVFQDEDAFRSLMKQSGFNESDVIRASHQTALNREATAKYGLGDLVRDRAQADEMKGFVTQAHRGAIADSLGRIGINGNQREQMAMTAANAAAATLFNMDPGALRDDAKRTRAVADSVRTSLAAQGVDVTKLSEAELITAADAGWGAFDEQVQRNPALRGYRHALPAIEAHLSTTADRRQQIDQENRISAAMRSATAGIGQAGPLARIMDSLQAPPADMSKLIGQALGGVDPDAVRAKMAALQTMTPAELQAAGITDRDRLGVMAQRFAAVAAGFGGTKAIVDPAQRVAKMGLLRDEAEALLGDKTKAQTLIDVALRDAGLARTDLDRAIKGEVGGLDAEARGRLQALSLAADKGITATAVSSGVSVGAKVGAAAIDEVTGASDRLTKAISGGDKDEALRHATQFAGTAADTASALAADKDGIAGLGAGGLNLVRGLRDRELKLRDLANRRTGGDVGKLLASGDADAANIRSSIVSDLAEVSRRQAAKPGTVTPMGKLERDELSAWHAANAAPEDEQNKALVERLLRETGGKLSPDEVSGLVSAIGTGPGAETARAAISRGLSARSELDKIATARKMDPAQLRAAARAGKAGEFAAGAAPDERARIDRLAGEAAEILRPGVNDEGASYRAYKKAIEASAGPAGVAVTQADDSGTKSVQKIVGTLRIEGLDRAVLSARMDPAGQGSTPVANS